jgi:hypothetical protein
MGSNIDIWQSTRYLGWRPVDAARLVPGLTYAAAAQGIRRFWGQAEDRTEFTEFVRQLRNKCQ